MGVIVFCVIAGLVLLVVFQGFRRGLKGKPSRAGQSANRPGLEAPHKWPTLGAFEFAVVGESNYQRALQAIAGDHGKADANATCVAELVPEDDNPHDDKAVSVRVNDVVVAYFARDDARRFRRRLGQKKLTGRTTYCDALVVGGGTKRGGERKHYGIQLDLKPFDD